MAEMIVLRKRAKSRDFRAEIESPHSGEAQAAPRSEPEANGNARTDRGPAAHSNGASGVVVVGGILPPPERDRSRLGGWVGRRTTAIDFSFKSE